MLSTRLELEKLQTEGVADMLRVQLLSEPFDNVKDGSGRVVVSLLIGQNPFHQTYNRSFAKTLKKDFVVEVNKHHEKEVLVALWTDKVSHVATAQALTIIRFLREQRDVYVQEYVRILKENTVEAHVEHDWHVDAVHPSGHFKVRHCRVCFTKETVGT